MFWVSVTFLVKVKIRCIGIWSESTIGHEWRDMWQSIWQGVWLAKILRGNKRTWVDYYFHTMEVGGDFIEGLPRSKRGNENIWIGVDLFTKSAYFILVRSTIMEASLAILYIKEVVWLRGVVVSIVSDRGPLITSGFWRNLHDGLGIELNLSMSYHS